jgi:hypothetical protein
VSKRRRSLTWSLVATLVVASLLIRSTPAAACPLDGGATNGTDSGIEFGMPDYPGDDNPYDDQGSYSVDNNWHDSWFYEWCTGNDQTRDQFLKWSQAAVDTLVANQCCRTLGVEVHVYPQTSYNCVCSQSTNLPYNFWFVAPWFWQDQQGYEEVSFIMDDPQLLVADTNYWTQISWSQEQTAFSWSETIVQWMENPPGYASIAWDAIGNWSKRTQQ